jgi:hypothetical protein
LESVVEHRRLFLYADPAASVSIIRELKPGVQKGSWSYIRNSEKDRSNHLAECSVGGDNCGFVVRQVGKVCLAKRQDVWHMMHNLHMLGIHAHWHEMVENNPLPIVTYAHSIPKAWIVGKLSESG